MLRPQTDTILGANDATFTGQHACASASVLSETSRFTVFCAFVPRPVFLFPCAGAAGLASYLSFYQDEGQPAVLYVYNDVDHTVRQVSINMTNRAELGASVAHGKLHELRITATEPANAWPSTGSLVQVLVGVVVVVVVVVDLSCLARILMQLLALLARLPHQLFQVARSWNSCNIRVQCNPPPRLQHDPLPLFLVWNRSRPSVLPPRHPRGVNRPLLQRLSMRILLG